MSEHNPEELARFWDDLASGDDLDSGELDPTLAETVQRLHSAKDVDAPDPAFIKRLVGDLMHAPSATSPGYGAAFPSVSPNGKSRQASWGPATRAPSTARAHPSRTYLQIASAVVLLVALGFGYVTFDPFGGGSDRPSSIPAAVAPAATPSALEATATVVSYSRAGHAIIGVWRLDVDPTYPGYNISYGIFNGDGTYVAYHESPGVSIGEWRATGERTVELSFIVQRPIPQDVFQPDDVLKGNDLEPTYFEVWRLSITIDESGTTMTSVGSLHAYDDKGNAVWGWDGESQQWIRMVLDPSAATGTPTP